MNHRTSAWILSLSLAGALAACSKEAEKIAEPSAENPAELPVVSAPAESGAKETTAPTTPTEIAKIEVAPEAGAGEPASLEAGEKAAGEAVVAVSGEKSAADEPSAEASGEKTAESKKSDKKKPGDKAAEAPAKESKAKFTELGIKVTKVGAGNAATAGKHVTIHYRALLVDAEKPFDSTFAAYRPLEVELGPDAKLQVIEGLRRGLEGMMPGSEMRLEIPATMAWGEKGNPAVGVPANADVIFEVQVLDVQ